MPASGAISDRVRDHLPYTWAALKADPKYGPDALQRRIDSVKAQIFGPSAHAENDEDDYPLLQQEYLGVLAALQLIPAGIEFWMNASNSVSTPGHGGAETATYTDRANQLRQLRDELIARAHELAPIADLPPVVSMGRVGLPMVSTQGELITTDPAEWGRRRELGSGGWPRRGSGRRIARTWPTW